MSAKFKEGDIIISKTGKYPARVTGVSYSWIFARYLHNEHTCSFDPLNVKLYNNDPNSTPMTNLYQFKSPEGNVIYGTHLATNQMGQWVMEEKGNSKLHTIDKNEAEEVLPYTFSVKMRGNTTHFVGVPDQVKVNDVLMYTGGDYPEIAIVTQLNTRNKGASSKFTGLKIVTEPLQEKP